ncbi:MAG: hypothetical protein AB1673_05335 [Actinomycetota bacterium]
MAKIKVFGAAADLPVISGVFTIAEVTACGSTRAIVVSKTFVSSPEPLG